MELIVLTQGFLKLCTHHNILQIPHSANHFHNWVAYDISKLLFYVQNSFQNLSLKETEKKGLIMMEKYNILLVTFRVFTITSLIFMGTVDIYSGKPATW